MKAISTSVYKRLKEETRLRVDAVKQRGKKEDDEEGRRRLRRKREEAIRI